MGRLFLFCGFFLTEKVLKKFGIKISDRDIDAVINCEKGTRPVWIFFLVNPMPDLLQDQLSAFYCKFKER